MTAAAPPERCANCGAGLTGEFCARCGQSREAIKRPFLTLLWDALDGALDWDGRLMTTLRRLFLRPGRVARDYVDGARASHTPPVRLYLVVSLFFFVGMALLDYRIVAVTFPDSAAFEANGALVAGTGEPDDGARTCPTVDDNVVITLFERGEAPAGKDFSEDEWACVEAAMTDSAGSAVVANMAVTALRDPAKLERSANAAAAQALIVMVAAFVLINAILHPRRRLIEHVVHSLYFHSALLVGMGALFALGVAVGRWQSAVVAVAAIGGLGYLASVVAFERGFYQAGWV